VHTFVFSEGVFFVSWAACMSKIPTFLRFWFVLGGDKGKGKGKEKGKGRVL
jgi:hypothetical protein